MKRRKRIKGLGISQKRGEARQRKGAKRTRRETKATITGRFKNDQPVTNAGRKSCHSLQPIRALPAGKTLDAVSGKRLAVYTVREGEKKKSLRK